ncbi:glycoside hydrolase family 48 protein [Aquimarina mytili]|uniref:Endoglucanase n=1 Tax=Aquimarina mytili TaxID=874423 RepID=A0A937D7W5_9FLAO|nr:glycoside hydrolase family 48 protein [Aquimarina mytili]MBL0682137.1 glycoside hydrolase family 9 protein [Aquimarina mytili]
MKNFIKLGTLLILCLLCCNLTTAQFNYGEALQKSIFFYEAQQSGPLPDWNRVPWRGDSALNDGSDVGLDLTGGWYDAGDHVKFNFPMAYSVTTLAWGGIEFKDAYIQAGQYDILKRNLRFVTDYFLKCHTGPQELWGQVAAGGIDHAWWGPAEVNPQPRESFKISGVNGGSDLAGETAAALAAVSILLKDDDPAYSARLLQSAEELYAYADQVREAYSNSITDAAGFYRSFSNFEDEIVWGAAWLYRATNDNKYLVKAEAEYDNMQREGQSATAKYKEAFSWDDKAYGAYVLMSILTGKDKYKQDAERNLDWWTGVGVNGDVVPTTPGGLPHIRQWGTLRYANNEAFLALVYSDKVSTNASQQTAYRNYAKFMADYTLGNNPINRSFMIGFGNDPANKPHHRGAHGGWTNNCSGVPDASSHILYGAVVGGPKSPANDGFADDRCEFIANEVACDYNAGITGVLAWMYGAFGGTPLANFPPASAGIPNRAEVRTMSKFNSNNASGSTVQIRVQNRTAWPARVTDKLSYRYFFDISEGVAQGLTIADYQPTLNAVQGSSTITIGTWDASRNIYYAEVSLTGEQIAPIGDPQFRRETQLNFRVSNGVPYDTSNDWSAQGIGGTEIESTNIPVYDNGVLVFGNEPDAGNTPIASFTATPESGVSPLDVQFDASASSDPNGDVLSYNWNFGNGQTSSVVDPLITYSQIGSYLVTLTVSDGQNISSEVSKTITVSDGNIAPVANFTATPTTGIAPVTVSFDGSTSSDENGDTLTYTWDFGDGSTGTGVTVTHAYSTVGEYTATLTVNDGSKTGTKTTTINVTDGSPVASFTTSTDSGTIPFDVSFDASASTDPTGGTLSYSWDFGNGLTATGATATTSFTEVGTYTVTLTVTNSVGSSSEIKTVTATDGNASCTFGTPTAEALPAINTEFTNIFVLGDGGPNLDNVTNFNINWDLANNGLYQFSMNTNNGIPSWWNDFLPKVTQNFNSAEPAITITGSGFSGLDGTYWVTIDNGNFVLVSQTGGFTIYFSTTATAPDCGVVTPPSVNGGTIAGGPFVFTVGDGVADNVSGITRTGNIGETSQWIITDDQGKILGLPPTPEAVDFDGAGVGSCFIYNVSYNGTITGLAQDRLLSGLAGDFDLSNSIEVVRNPVITNPTVDGGTIAGGPFVFTVGDGVADNVSGITRTGNIGETSQWIITDDQGKILGLPPTPEVVDFDGAGVGSCFIYNISYNGMITGLAQDGLLSGLTGEFDLSNSIEVVRNPVSTGGDCTFGTPLANALPSINSEFENIYVLGNGGPNLDNVTKFNINWDLANNGLYVLSINTNNGQPNWYVDLRSSLTYSFNTANPDATFSGTGITGLDGSYWVTQDQGNFAMVSKTGGFTIYFSTSTTAPTCGGSGNTPPVADISATPISGEAPLVVTFDASGSTDVDGDTLTYDWNFGDGNSGTGAITDNTFTSKGTYEVNLTVSDGKGGEDTAVISISVTDGDIIINPPTGDNEYVNRFIEMRNEFYDPANGYFSADGSPHHSIETLIVEAPDHGHESTSELYSYWLWLEVMNGRVTGDWAPLGNVWDKIEQFIIPTKADQPTNAAYNPSSPAAYAAEFALPSSYPAPLEFSAPVGSDPVSPDLTAAYGADIYQMHWLLDNDNFYGFGNRGDGISTPSYINTFQRGEQESVYETVPHPSWESFDWGGTNGYLPLFIEDQNYAKQWRYTSAPDADARAVQAMYWAQVYAKEQGISLASLDLDKATKMGDYLRLAMFDKYFKPLGVQSATSGAGTGYNSAHYLMSWYMSWGGSADPASQWAFRIGSSHCHFGYQNPIAAYAMSQVQEFEPKSQNGKRDWTESLKRQMEFYTWLQSREGAIAGGATNSWNGDYSPYPAGKSTFYDMAYDDNPVYEDPGSGTWFGWQAWSMERVAEYYYITNDAMAKNLMDKWVDWVKSEVRLIAANDFEIPATLEWTGEPDTWDPTNPGTNSNLSVTVTGYSQDLGVAASMAKALIYYAAATQKHATLDTDARDLAKEVLDRMWTTYRDEKGVSSPENRGDFSRIFEQEVYVPQGFNGIMPNGDVVQPGVSFLDIRSDLRNDPEFDRLQTAYNAGQEYTQRYHRSWAQIEVALANAEYGFFFGETTTAPSNRVSNMVDVLVSPNPASSFINISAPLSTGIGKSSTSKVNNLSIRLINLTGNVVRSKNLRNSQQVQARISVDGVPSGIYILEVSNATTGEISRNKVIVNR